MQRLLLTPTDVLFFRDGRPMAASLSGHGAAWPLPNVLDAALHAALHRAFPAPLAGERGHRDRGGRSGQRFGGLVCAGPFPVRGRDDAWLFPRPADTGEGEPQAVSLRPCFPAAGEERRDSLPRPLRAAVANTELPVKVGAGAAPRWWTAAAFAGYTTDAEPSAPPPARCATDGDLFGPEHTVGVGLNAATGTAEEGKLYSAHYLRLREGVALGALADLATAAGAADPLRQLFAGNGRIVVGGQGRVCSAALLPAGENAAALPLPEGRRDGFPVRDGQHLVKWTLLSPAIWPRLAADEARAIRAHPGGSLPNWVDADTGAVRLVDGPGVSKARRLRRPPGRPVRARLAAALVPRPVVVTGWSLGSQTGNGPGGGAEESEGEPVAAAGAKSTHLAVPAGAVYYFTCPTAADAATLAAVLNWHGRGPADAIRNRRSALCGEKGFGLGLCAPWLPHPASGPVPADLPGPPPA